MADSAHDPVAGMGAVPLTFAVDRGHCFGWFHAAQGPSRQTGIVLCRPVGYEAICAYGSYTQLAEALAAEGFDVIRFDYQGTGDATGDDADPDRVPSWIASIIAAAAELRRRAHITALSLFGVRLGVTLAVEAAVRMGGVDTLVAWAPCGGGRAFVRELRAASLGRALATGDAAPGDMEALGYRYSVQTVAALQGLDTVNPRSAPARRALVIGRDDMPAEGPMPSSWRQAGVDTAYAVVPGYAEMMAEPRESPLPPALLQLLKDWLGAAHPVRDGSMAATGTPAGEAVTAGWQDGKVRESTVRLGPAQLFGILSGPAYPAPEDRRADTAVLMLNVGGNYRIGPSRIYVRMARSLAALGYRALRLDLPGIGDSRTSEGFSMGGLYSKDFTQEVRGAIDFLAGAGCRKFFLLGICSGSFVAFQTALADERVTGQILMNSRLLEWQDPQQAGTWQGAMQSYYKSTNFYRRALLRPGVYSRLIRGQVDVAGIARRLGAVVAARLKRAVAELVLRSRADEGVLAKVKRLAARGTDTLMIIAAQDDGRDYVEYHFGSHGSRMHGHARFRMIIVENTDHTFSDLESQQFVIRAVTTHLEALRDIGTPPSPAEIATTAPVMGGRRFAVTTAQGPGGRGPTIRTSDPPANLTYKKAGEATG
ncbi:MAG: hypothetical protein JWQ72_3394 [Polaromonas sp.]|nr:hypothetical protein [Polaromonas sp.]